MKVTDGDGNVNKITEVQIDGGSWSTSDAKKVEISNCTMSPCENIFHVCDHATWPSKVVNGSQVLRFRTENPIKVGSKVQVIRQEFGAVNQSDTFVPTSACGGGMHPCKLTGGFHVYLSKAVDGVYIKGSEKLFSMEGKLNHEASVDTGNVPK